MRRLLNRNNFLFRNSTSFANRHIGPDNKEIKDMLRCVGRGKIKDLDSFTNYVLPENIKVNHFSCVSIHFTTFNGALLKYGCLLNRSAFCSCVIFIYFINARSVL